MAGRVTKHIKIREANDQNYGTTKRKEMMNIINSADRFSEENGQLFIASVKSRIDKNHINDHINFPPIQRKRTYKTYEKIESIICLVPKCYSAIDREIDDEIRMKSINEKKIPVTQFQLKNGVISMVKITKSALTGVVDKMIVIDSDNSKGQSYPCAPQMMNVDTSDYRHI
ncbi:MAG: hypothetical protein EZS28_013423 [Streblomastix strix]|uniref:Uncharacterized protein n=1 Tax=Streblomastix strix TaxID=222440 RepID=A0A5J4W9L0_9EUKA|nr:MAG: hypothetical protein EZS28_013423 [Streblomastix strix]